jgi:hypothetical protein
MSASLSMNHSRFRWITVQRALDLLVADSNFTNAKAVALIEEIGCGPEIDRLPASERTTPKLRNLLSRACREEPPRRDTEGMLLSERIVRVAASYVPRPEPQMPWNMEERSESEPIAAFRNSLAVDGWSVEGGQLVPNTAVALAEPRSRLRRLLKQCGADEALRRLDQLEKGLDEGHWESANGDARGFLNSVFEVIASALPQTRGQDLKEGAARSALQEVGFLRPDPKDNRKSLEGAFVHALASLLGSDGAHTGSSDPDSAVFRYSMTVITGDYFLGRLSKTPR